MRTLRRSMLFVPGNNPAMIRDANLYNPDSIVFDLEDSVALNEKDAARFLVYNALTSLDFGKKELSVRINDLSTHFGITDLEAMIRAGVHMIRLPKAESAADIVRCEREMERIEREAGIELGRTGLMATIESARGVLNAREIASASKRLVCIALGAEDYLTDIRTERGDGAELFFARGMILNAARAAGIAAVDAVFSDVNDEEGFIAEARLIRQLGFDGKSVIHPRQIAPLHRVFAPRERDVASARAVVQASQEAAARGSGVVSLNGRMIDKPVVERALYMLELARVSGMLPPDEI